MSQDYKSSLTNYTAHIKKIFAGSLGALLGISIFGLAISFIPILIILGDIGEPSKQEVLIGLLAYVLFCVALWLLIYLPQIIALTVKLLLKKLPPGPITREMAKELLLEKVKDTSRKTIRVKQVNSKRPDIFSSKIGGIAYWPKSLENSYPMSDRGNKLRLLAQIRLEELPINEYLPKTGMLQFFVEDADYMFGLFVDEQNRDNSFKSSRHKVIYHKDVITDANLLVNISVENSKTKSSFPVRKETALEFVVEEEYMSLSDYRFPANATTQKLVDTYATSNFRELLFDSGFSKLFGYPYFTQFDPRLETETEPYELLLQLFSEGSVMWGDAGVGNFFIRPSDLKKLNFENTMYYWDCG